MDDGVRSEVDAGEEVAPVARALLDVPILPDEPVREGAGPGFLVKKPLSVDCFLTFVSSTLY